MMPRTCVAPSGRFVYGVHKPSYSVSNLRQDDTIQVFGTDLHGRPLHNHINFPRKDLKVSGSEIIFEIPNPFSFRGSTYILKSWADAKVEDGAVRLPTFSRSIVVRAD